jgi:NADH-ubiquinone oxidoreductase chain 5
LTVSILMISLLVHIYSIEYLSYDPYNQRFLSNLSLFNFMMILLVTEDNYLIMFVGWEGVGVCSYWIY